MVIGFVGLGIMGKPMAKNLCRAGYTLIVNDHHKENVDELVQAGARSGDLKQIGMKSDVVITMLPNSPQVKDVMLGENGIAGYMKKGTCLDNIFLSIRKKLYEHIVFTEFIFTQTNNYRPFLVSVLGLLIRKITPSAVFSPHTS